MGKLYIDSGKLIVNLFVVGRFKLIDLGQIDKLAKHIYKGLAKGNHIKDYDDVIFEMDNDSIQRVVSYNDHLFEMVGDTIILKCDKIPDEFANKYTSDAIVQKLIEEFTLSKT